MATISAVTVANTDEALVVVWPGLDAVDEGSAVDVGRYTKLYCRIYGTFADTDAFALQGAGYTTAGAAGTYATLETDVGFPGGGSSVSATAAATFTVEKLGGVKWVKPMSPTGSTEAGTSAVTVIIVATRETR